MIRDGARVGAIARIMLVEIGKRKGRRGMASRLGSLNVKLFAARRRTGSMLDGRPDDTARTM